MDTEQFIKKAREIHGNKYDYSLVKYVHSKKKIIIICKEHGRFQQIPNSHLSGRGCPKCARVISHINGTIKERKKKFIEKARWLHRNRYDYTDVNYKSCEEVVAIKCPQHGLFLITPRAHLRGSGCPICKAEQLRIERYNKFIKKACIVHKHKYDYSKVIYKSNKENVVIICPIHGEFLQTPNNHLAGHGCTRCYEELRRLPKLTQLQFIKLASKIHNNKYDYSQTKYRGRRNNIIVVCPIHGKFKQLADNHLAGSGCPKCAKEKKKLSFTQFVEKATKRHGDKYIYKESWFLQREHGKIKIECPIHGLFYQHINSHLSGSGCKECYFDKISGDTKRFIERAKKIHGDKYNYSLVEYYRNNKPVNIICEEHGSFWQLPYIHLRGAECPKCQRTVSKDQQRLIEFIQGFYESDIFINDREQIAPYELDIYFPLLKLAIEYNGSYWHSKKTISGRTNQHQFKHLKCKECGIKLIQVNEVDWHVHNKQVKSMLRGYIINGSHLAVTKLNSVKSGTVFVNCRFGEPTKEQIVDYLIKYGCKGAIIFVDADHGGGSRIEGLELIGLEKPQLIYVKHGREAVRVVRKKQLKSLLGDFDPNLSIADNMFARGYRAMWTSGRYKYIMKG